MLSTTAWSASCFGRENSDDDCDDLKSTAHGQLGRSDWCSYSSDEEWSDEENDEICGELDSDDVYNCPYELLTLEEALRQFDENKKSGLASGNHASLAAIERIQVDANPRNFDAEQ